jgi:tellurium resistance protein TerD
MAITLNKGGNLSLSKTDPNLTNMIVGLGWDARSTDGQEFDLDASLFMVKEDGKVRSESDFIFYNQLKSTCGSIEHTGEIYRHGGEWKFKAVGQGFAGGLKALANQHGITV